MKHFIALIALNNMRRLYKKNAMVIFYKLKKQEMKTFRWLYEYI